MGSSKLKTKAGAAEGNQKPNTAMACAGGRTTRKKYLEICCIELLPDFPRAHVPQQANRRGDQHANVLGGRTLSLLPTRCHGQRARVPLAQAQRYCGKASGAGQEREVGTKSTYIKGSEGKKHKRCQNA